ncbi:MAG: hypothetical protein H6849_00150 [Alphaproteobacteria bacterium]|nr:MAG: hypothetical protein H6849_00150 [Alphaproteobacteria bacterium]
MPIIYRNEKGSPLSIEEIDGNFRYLNAQLVDQQEAISQIKRVTQVVREGSDLVFKDDADTVLYRVEIPLPRFSSRGSWCPSTVFVYGDIVHQNGDNYICLVTHTAEIWDHERENWLLMAQKNDPFSVLKQPRHTTTDDEPPTQSEQERSENLARGFSLPTLPIFPLSNLPDSRMGALIFIALEETDTLIMSYGTPTGWMNALTHERVL